MALAAEEGAERGVGGEGTVALSEPCGRSHGRRSEPSRWLPPPPDDTFDANEGSPLEVQLCELAQGDAQFELASSPLSAAVTFPVEMRGTGEGFIWVAEPPSFLRRGDTFLLVWLLLLSVPLLVPAPAVDLERLDAVGDGDLRLLPLPRLLPVLRLLLAALFRSEGKPLVAM